MLFERGTAARPVLLITVSAVIVVVISGEEGEVVFILQPALPDERGETDCTVV